MSIVFENVTKAYDTAVLENVTLNFEDKKITALLGASGRGKTTVLRLLSSLEKAKSGKVSTDGKVSYLFQEHRLVPTLTAYENVYLVCKDENKAKRARKRICHYPFRTPTLYSRAPFTQGYSAGVW